MLNKYENLYHSTSPLVTANAFPPFPRSMIVLVRHVQLLKMVVGGLCSSNTFEKYYKNKASSRPVAILEVMPSSSHDIYLYIIYYDMLQGVFFDWSSLKKSVRLHVNPLKKVLSARIF